MIKPISILKNDNGSVLVLAILILVLLTIIGMSAVNTSNTELQITTNSQVHKMAFYAAETGWQMQAQALLGATAVDVNLDDLGADLSPLVRYDAVANHEGDDYGDGWQTDIFIERDYVIRSTGTAPRNATSEVTVSAMNLVKYRQYE